MDSLKKQTRIHKTSRLRVLLAKNTNNRRCQKNSLYELRQFLAWINWKYSCFLHAKSPHARKLDRKLFFNFNLYFRFKNVKERSFTIHSQLTLKRSGFALRPFPSRNAFSVQNFYPTLVKREDARSGCTASSFNSQLSPNYKSPVTNYPSQKKAQTLPDRKRSPDKYLPIAERKHTYRL